MKLHLSILILIILCGLIWEEEIREWMVEYRIKGEKTFSYAAPWVIVFGYIAFLAAMRTRVNDTSVYIRSFNALKPYFSAISDELEIYNYKFSFVSILGILFKMFVSDNYHAWFALFSVTESLLLIRVFRRECVSFFDTCFLFFCAGHYFNYFNMMRQWAAVVITFSGIYCIANQEFTKYIVICLIASLFHPSALFMIPIYFAVRGKPWSNKSAALIAVFVFGMLFLNPLLSSMSDIMENTTYDYVFNRLQTNTGSSWVRIVIRAVPVVLSYWFIPDVEDPVIDVCVNMSIVTMLLNILATFTNGLYVIRFSGYTGLFDTILYPYLLNVALKDNKNRMIIKSGFYILFFVYYIYSMNHTGSFRYYSDVLGLFE